MAEKRRGIIERQARERQAQYHGNQHEVGLPVILPEVQKGDTRDILSASIGVSGSTYDALVKVVKNGTAELVDAVPFPWG